jgi:hypothetical protein
VGSYVPDLQKYFVRHLPEGDLRRARGQIYQVQVVDKYGQATAFAYLGADEMALDVGGRPIPEAVIRAARDLPAGRGDFVDSEGHILAPKDLLT